MKSVEKQSSPKISTEKKSPEEIVLSEIKNHRLFLVDEAGDVKIGKNIFKLGPEFSDTALVKIDSEKFGICRREQLFVSSRTIGGTTAEKFSHILTTSTEGEFKISPYIIEEALPQREDEDNLNYKERTLLHEDSFSSNARIELVESRINHGAGISLEDLNHREKVSLANYYLSNPSRNHEPIINFAKKFGEDGLKTLLACEYGMKTGDQIIYLGEKLPPEKAEKIFDKYNEIVNLCDRVLDEVKDKFKKEATPKTVDKVRNNLLSRAKKLLNSFYAQAGKSTTPEDMMRELDNISTDIMLFAATFKSLAEEDKVKLTEITDTKIETKTAEDLSPSEREEMLRIFIQNRGNYSAELLKLVSQEFEQSLDNQSATFYVLRFDDKITSFMRTEPRGEGRLYAGSFNVRPEAKGSEIGTAMMEEIIDRLAQENIIEIVANADKKGLIKFYQEKFKFRIKEIIDNYQGTGEKFFRMERNDHQKSKADYALAA